MKAFENFEESGGVRSFRFRPDVRLCHNRGPLADLARPNTPESLAGSPENTHC